MGMDLTWLVIYPCAMDRLGGSYIKRSEERFLREMVSLLVVCHGTSLPHSPIKASMVVRNHRLDRATHKQII